MEEHERWWKREVNSGISKSSYCFFFNQFMFNFFLFFWSSKQTIKESSLFFQLYFEFARNLPEKRAVDYQLSLTNSAAEPKEKKVVEKKSKEKKEKDET